MIYIKGMYMYVCIVPMAQPLEARRLALIYAIKPSH